MGLLKYETQSPVPTATPLSDVYGEIIGLCFPLCYSISEQINTRDIMPNFSSNKHRGLSLSKTIQKFSRPLHKPERDG